MAGRRWLPPGHVHFARPPSSLEPQRSRTFLMLNRLRSSRSVDSARCAATARSTHCSSREWGTSFSRSSPAMSTCSATPIRRSQDVPHPGPRRDPGGHGPTRGPADFRSTDIAGTCGARLISAEQVRALLVAEAALGDRIMHALMCVASAWSSWEPAARRSSEARATATCCGSKGFSREQSSVPAARLRYRSGGEGADRALPR